MSLIDIARYLGICCIATVASNVDPIDMFLVYNDQAR